MKESFNRRALRLFTVLAVLSGAVIAALFFGVAQSQIRQRATATLLDFAADSGGEEGKISPEIYFVSTDEIGDDALAELDRELLEYYLRHEKSIPMEKVCRFLSGDLKAYFFARAAAQGGVLLFYTDVSFPSSLVRTATMMMAIVVIALSLLLYRVQRYTVKVLDAKDQGMKDFFANASHELKTPLMAIRSYADGLAGGLVEQEKACSVISKEADRMTGLVNAILEFSKLDSGAVQLHLAENDVREILYDAIQVIEQAAEQKGIEIIPDLPAPLLLPCDEEFLFSAFSNILTNCIRYAERHIAITASRQKSPAALTVAISNDGEPISKQDAAHLFERFYKGANGQTGIGMALSLEYIRLHGGKIAVFPQDRQTIFEVTIPNLHGYARLLGE